MTKILVTGATGHIRLGTFENAASRKSFAPVAGAGGGES